MKCIRLLTLLALFACLIPLQTIAMTLETIESVPVTVREDEWLNVIDHYSIGDIKLEEPDGALIEKIDYTSDNYAVEAIFTVGEETITATYYNSVNVIKDSSSKFGDVVFYREGDSWYRATSSHVKAEPARYVAGYPAFIGTARWLTYIVPTSDHSYARFNISGTGDTAALEDFLDTATREKFNPLRLQYNQLIKNKEYAEVFWVDEDWCLRWIVNESAAERFYGPTWNHQGVIKEFTEIPRGYTFCGNIN